MDCVCKNYRTDKIFDCITISVIEDCTITDLKNIFFSVQINRKVGIDGIYLQYYIEGIDRLAIHSELIRIILFFFSLK